MKKQTDKKYIFTFWEPKSKIPAYIQLCMDTWKKFLPEYEKDKVNVSLANSDCGIRINTESSEEIMNSYFCRELLHKIQKIRKESGIKIEDTIAVVYALTENSKRLKVVSETMKETIEKAIKAQYLDSDKTLEGFVEHKKENVEIGEEKEVITVTIYKKTN